MKTILVFNVVSIFTLCACVWMCKRDKSVYHVPCDMATQPSPSSTPLQNGQREKITATTNCCYEFLAFVLRCVWPFTTTIYLCSTILIHVIFLLFCLPYFTYMLLAYSHFSPALKLKMHNNKSNARQKQMMREREQNSGRERRRKETKKKKSHQIKMKTKT